MFKFQIESEVQRAFPSVVKALDASGISFFIKNEQLRYVHANDNLLHLLQYEDISNLTDFDLFVPKVASEQLLIEEQVLRSEMPHQCETIILGKNSVEKVLEINRSIYREGSQVYLIGIIKDITESKQQEQFEAYRQVLTKEDVSEKIINRFSSYIFNNNDEQVILDGVGQMCLELLDLEDISIFLYNEESKLLEHNTFLGTDKRLQYNQHNPKFLELGEGIVGSAAFHKSSMIVEDIGLDQRYVKGLLDARSELAIPIIYKTNLIGVLDTEHSSKNFFEKDHIVMLEGIAGLLAIKLHEVRNYKKLRTKSAQLEAFVQNAPAAMVMLDKEFRYLAISDYWKSSYEISDEQDLLGRSHFELNPNLPIRWRKLIERSMMGETINMERECFQRLNGKREWYSAKVSPWYTKANEVGGVIINAEIVTDHIRKESLHQNTYNELMEARKLGKLFSWEFHPETGKTLWSKGMLFNGDDDENTKVSSLLDLVEPDFKADFNKAVYRAIEEKSGFQLIHPILLEGKKYWVHTRGELELEGDRITKMRGTAQDITEQVLTEESIAAKNLELEKINDELDQFVYKTAHDLRAPLTNLIGLIGVMRNETDHELLQTYFDLQEKSVERMDAFINKIAHFTKNTRLPVRIDKIDISSLIDEVFGEYLFYEQSERVEKTVVIECEQAIYTDTERLKTVLSNLVSNSIKFTDPRKPKPSLNIGVICNSDYVEIQVEDNGLGMSETVKSKAFEMFYRGHNTSDGTGVGLYIVKEAVNKLNGKISLNSKELEGTTVVIRLPNLSPVLV